MQAARNTPPSSPPRHPLPVPDRGTPVHDTSPPGRPGPITAASLLVPFVAGLRADAGAPEPLVASITILGSGRLGPTASALLGLVGTVIGGFSLARARERTRAGSDVTATGGRRGADAALGLGAISLVLGIVFLAAADGGPGTGNGVVGSVAALGLGAVAMVLGGLARTRRRQGGSISHA